MRTQRLPSPLFTYGSGFGFEPFVAGELPDLEVRRLSVQGQPRTLFKAWGSDPATGKPTPFQVVDTGTNVTLSFNAPTMPTEQNAALLTTWTDPTSGPFVFEAKLLGRRPVLQPLP